MKVTQEQAVKALKKHGTATKAAESLGMVRSTFQRLVKQAQPSEKQPATPMHVKKLSEFREKYDKSFYLPKKIKAALVQLGNGWEYEVEFARLAGVSLTDLNSVREQFLEYVVTIGRDSRRAWAGSKAIAEQMRKML